MAEVRISMGGTPVTLTRSDSLVAIKRRPGSPTDARAITELTTGDALHAGRQLGGFELVGVGTGTRAPERVLDSLQRLNVVTDGTEVFYTSDDKVPFVPTGQVYVEFTEQATDDDIHRILDTEHLELHETRGARTFILTSVPGSGSVIDKVTRLQDNRNVKVVEPDLATFGQIKAASKAAFALPSDSLLCSQWHLQNVGFHRNTKVGFKQGADARVVEAWRFLEALGSPEITVAIIDDGFDLTHPDLAGPDKIVAPHDFARSSSDPSPDLAAEDWHGTACAGVAIGNANGQLILGAAPGCRLMPVRWGQNLSDAQVESWFDWARVNGASVVSCSWGAAANVYALSTRQQAAIARCAREGRDGKGAVICFAAGNANRDINDPPRSLDGFAAHPDVIAVAACTSRDERSNYSNFGAAIWVCAPSSGAGGWGITTSDVTGTITVNGYTFELGYAPGPVTYDFGGTSSACPLVAGVCALILSANPGLTSAQVKDVLARTARRIGAPEEYNGGHSRYFGFGCVNALAAVKAATSARSAVP